MKLQTRKIAPTLALLALASAASAQWTLENNNTPAAVRTITRSSVGLVGGRVGGSPNAIEVWASTNDGVNWSRIGTVASSSTIQYGDACFLSDGGTLVYCAFREQSGSHFQITVCRSTNGGSSWTYDSTVASNDRGLFLGAPYLWFSRDGNVQCYYDSEQAATDAGQPGKQWIMENARPKFSFGAAWTTYIGVASRPSNAGVFARDGLSTVVNLDGNDMMLVCESVDPANTARNALYSVLSHDNGHTWDFTSRQRIWAPSKNGVQFNAYCPVAIRYGGGPVGVAFCTDDDFTSPSSDSTAPGNRNAHIKFIQTLSTFQSWGGLQTIEAGASTMYAPGLFELRSNVILAICDLFGGRQTVRQRG